MPKTSKAQLEIPRVLPLTWNEKMERALLNGLVEQHRAAGHPEGGFKKEVWQVVLPAVQAQVTLQEADGKPRQITQQQASNKLSDFKQLYTIWADLFAISTAKAAETGGRAIDPQTGAINLPDDVWSDFIQHHRKARRFQTGPMPFLEQCEELFLGRIAAGRQGATPQEILASRTNPPQSSHPPPSADERPIPTPRDSRQGVSMLSSPPTGPHVNGLASAKRRKRTRMEVEEQEDEQEEEPLALLAQALEHFSRAVVKLQERQRPVQDRAVDKLYRDFSDKPWEWLLDVAQVLEKPTYARMYLAVPKGNAASVIEAIIADKTASAY